MKKTLLSALCLLCVVAAWAQKPVGQLSFIPRVGLNLSNLSIWISIILLQEVT